MALPCMFPAAGPCRPPLLLLLFLLAPPGLDTGCHVGTSNECRRAASVPGMELSGEGFDVVQMRSTGAWVVDTQSWRLAGGGCTLCENRQMKGVAQRLPKAVAHWHVSTHCRRRLSGTVYSTAEELTASQHSLVDSSWSTGLDVQPKPDSGAKATVAGERSKMADYARAHSSSDRYSFSSQSFTCRLYEGSLGPRPPLSPHFLHTLRLLPKVVGGASQRFFYRRFLNTFGTHYVKGVSLGGSFRDITALRTCQVTAERQTVEEVKDCLSIEAEAKISTKLESTAKYRKCQEAREQTESKRSFHQMYSDRHTELAGGTLALGTDLFFSSDPSAFSSWLGSLAAHPGVVHRVLEPLHLLLHRNDPRRGHLREAISHYIVGSRGAANCSSPPACPRGAWHDPVDPCSCRCTNGQRVDTMCCSKEKGWGKLVVEVKSAQDLWGDYTTATDAFVRVSYGPGMEASTAVVWNNDNPVWDATLDLGDLRIMASVPLRLEVWDKDNGYDDDLLGSCQQQLTPGHHVKVCYPSRGSLTFNFSLTCGPHLGGDTCQDYVARRG